MSSDYYKSLTIEAQQRYKDKLSFAGEEFPDPLDVHLDSLFQNDRTKWPSITLIDMYEYFVNGTCFYTKDAFRAHKSLESYNYIISGKVTDPRIFRNKKLNVTILKGQIDAGQTAKKFYSAWSMVKNTGEILNGHCTCMAGLGEACSHLGALIETVQLNVQEDYLNPPCTSMPCTWNSVKKPVEICKVVNMDFKKPKTRKRNTIATDKHNKQARMNPTQIHSQSTITKIASQESIAAFISQCKETDPGAIIISSFDDSGQTDTANEIDEIEVSHVRTACSSTEPKPDPMDRLSDVLKNFPELPKQNPECFFSTIKFSDTERKLIEEDTRLQWRGNDWFLHRKGKITTSLFDQVRKCKSAHESLVKKILQYENQAQSASMRWGLENEKHAIESFLSIEMLNHKNLKVHDTGLFIHKDYSFLGASPDGLVTCDCCQPANLEVKCLYNHRNETVSEAKPLFLDENLDLKKSHEYYCQIQGQMAITEKSITYFVVYTTKQTLIQKITVDITYWEKLLEKLLQFFVCHVVKELTTQSIKKKIEGAAATCYCVGKRNGAIIQCRNCKGYFHLKCTKQTKKCNNWQCNACYSVDNSKL